jgi:hypothetical protein
MNVKWWRWWIVPLILTILMVSLILPNIFEVLTSPAWRDSLNSSTSIPASWYVLSLAVSFSIVLIGGMFLGLAWPVALITHVIWKRRKARKQGALLQPGMQAGPEETK